MWFWKIVYARTQLEENQTRYTVQPFSSFIFLFFSWKNLISHWDKTIHKIICMHAIAMPGHLFHRVLAEMNQSIKPNLTACSVFFFFFWDLLRLFKLWVFLILGNDSSIYVYVCVCVCVRERERERERERDYSFTNHGVWLWSMCGYINWMINWVHGVIPVKSKVWVVQNC